MKRRLTSVEPAFENDLVDLIKSEVGDQAIAVEVFTLLSLIAKGELGGLPLEERESTADLADCRKVSFDLDPMARPNFRLFYRLLPHEQNPNRVQAVSVGYRANLDAYVRAARNLDR